MNFKKYLRPKRLLRLALFIFGTWGVYTNYQAHWPDIQARFRNQSEENILGKTVEQVEQTVGEQINRVLDKKVINVSQPDLNSEGEEGQTTSSQTTTRTIVEIVKKDLRQLPQREVRKIQKQICKEWLEEEYEEVVEVSPTVLPGTITPSPTATE